jgi:hypothetical protein
MRDAQQNGLYPVTVNNLSFYRVSAFDEYPYLKHAIFTRNGGVSQAPFDSLNLSSSVGDSPQAVRENSRYACQAVQVELEQTVSCHLVHGADILTINKANRRLVMGQADGLVTGEPDIYLFMRFADCVPLLFFDPVSRAVGLTHAGWRGLVKNAAGATVEAMVNRLGCRPENIISLIGPSIGPCCYEVGPDVIEAVAQVFAEPARLFKHDTDKNGLEKTGLEKISRAYFDMWEANRRQLTQAGIRHIIQAGLCTACRTHEFFSHRAEKGRTGRFGVLIGIEANRP